VSDWLCQFAALGGHLDVLQWAREENFHWGDSTCARAAEGGHLHVLQWAREHGCPWDLLTCINYAHDGDHFHIVDWIELQED